MQNIKMTIVFRELYQTAMLQIIWYMNITVFKLADLMRSMRTNGASKNRVVFVCLTFAKNGDDFPLFSIWIIFGTYGMFQYVYMNT